jgi:RNA polymerase sigma-70 factor, ECF subfamily
MTTQHCMSDDSSTDDLEGFIGTVFAEERLPLTRYVRRLLPADPHRAEDVVQETLLRAWRSGRCLLQAGTPVRPWLFTVARNLVIDWRRRDQARPCEVDASLLNRVASPENAVEQILDRQVVAAAFAELSAAHREVLYHLHYRGRTCQEAARVMGVPAGTVKSRAFYACRALHEALSARGVLAA